MGRKTHMDIQCDGGEGVPSQRRDRSIRSQIPPSPLTSPTRNRLVSYPPGQEGQPIAQAGAVMIARRGERPGGQRLRLESIAKKPQTGQDFPGLAGEISNKRLRARRGKKIRRKREDGGGWEASIGASIDWRAVLWLLPLLNSMFLTAGGFCSNSEKNCGSPGGLEPLRPADSNARLPCVTVRRIFFFLSFFRTSRRLTFPIQPAEHPVPEPKTGIDCRKNALTRPDSQARPVADIIQHNR